MATYFADTSFWVALLDRRDTYHPQAIDVSKTISGTIVTTEAVLLETVNTFSRQHWRERVIALINHIVARDDVEVVPFDSNTWTLGWSLFVSRADKSWSLTDCISMEVMQQRGLSEAQTADAHFSAYPKSPSPVLRGAVRGGVFNVLG